MIAIFMSGAIALIVSLFSTRFLIRFFKNLGKGQPILTKDENNAVVAEHGHVGRAAEALGLGQPALSKSLRRLEQAQAHDLPPEDPWPQKPSSATPRS